MDTLAREERLVVRMAGTHNQRVARGMDWYRKIQNKAGIELFVALRAVLDQDESNCPDCARVVTIPVLEFDYVRRSSLVAPWLSNPHIVHL